MSHRLSLAFGAVLLSLSVSCNIQIAAAADAAPTVAEKEQAAR